MPTKPETSIREVPEHVAVGGGEGGGGDDGVWPMHCTKHANRSSGRRRREGNKRQRAAVSTRCAAAASRCLRIMSAPGCASTVKKAVMLELRPGLLSRAASHIHPAGKPP